MDPGGVLYVLRWRADGEFGASGKKPQLPVTILVLFDQRGNQLQSFGRFETMAQLHIGQLADAGIRCGFKETRIMPRKLLAGKAG